MLMKMAESNTVRDAQLTKHSEQIDRVEVLFARLDQQLPNLARCVEVCLEVGSSTMAIASTLTTIRDQTETTTQTVTQRLNDMEETIRDTFVDLKVDLLTSTVTLMERTIGTCFTAVDLALVQMASPTNTAGATDGPQLLVNPTAPTNVSAPPSADMALPGSASQTGNKDAPLATRFQATPMFCPGSTFPAGNWVSHMKEAGHPDGDFNRRPWRAQDRDDTGVQATSRHGSALPDTRLSHFRDGRPLQAQTQ